MKRDVLTVKRRNQTAIPWFFLVAIVFILSIVVVFSAIPSSLAAQSTMEVYQQNGRKVFGQAVQLDIFDDPALGGQKLVHPFTSGSYTFAVYNNSDSELLPYSLDIVCDNAEDIPLVFSLQKNGAYVYGGSGPANMLSLSEVYFPETLLGGKSTDLYTLEWAWITQNDSTDTALGNNGTQLHHLTITAIGTMPAADSLPSTGDSSNLLLWFAALSVGSLLFILLLFGRKKDENKDENNQGIPQNI